jgi:hypothetical protein
MIQVILGALVALGGTILIEYLRKPHLRIELGPHSDGVYSDQHPAKDARFLRLRVVNLPLPRWARWMCRNTAIECRGFLTFYHIDDGQAVFDNSMQIRWTRTPEPVPRRMLVDGKSVSYIDPGSFPPRISKDIHADQSELVDVVARFEQDEECYGWSNESYFSEPRWRNPTWKLGPKRYLVKVEITSPSDSCVGLFRLINDVHRSSFRLEDKQRGDWSKIA